MQQALKNLPCNPYSYYLNFEYPLYWTSIWKVLSSIALLLLTIKSGIAQTKTDSARESRVLLTIDKSCRTAQHTGDTASYDKYTTADLLVVNEDGSRDGKTSFLRSSTPCPKGIQDTSIL